MSERCGSYAGYQWHTHNRHAPPPCEPCRNAARLYMQNRRKDPIRRRQDSQYSLALNRALWKLKARHPDEFAVLADEELAEAGFTFEREASA